MLVCHAHLVAWLESLLPAEVKDLTKQGQMRGDLLQGLGEAMLGLWENSFQKDPCLPEACHYRKHVL